MKKLIAILALMAMGSAAMAQFSVDTTTPGQATINVPDGILGIGLDVTVSNGTLDSVDVNGFNVFIDDAWQTLDGGGTLPAELPVGTSALANVMDRGVAALSDNFAICAGFLAENNPGTAGATIVLEAADGADVVISENDKRGGVVNAAGSVDFTELVFTIDAEQQGPACWNNPNQAFGDINNDGKVDTLDWPIFRDSFGSVDGGAGYNPCADLNRDGKIDTLDWPIFRDNFGKTL